MFVHLGLAVNVGDVMLLFVVVVTDTVSTSQHTRHQWLLLLHITTVSHAQLQWQQHSN